MSKYYLGIAQFVIVLPYDGSSSGTTFLRLNLSLSLSLSLSLKFNESIVLFLRRLKSEPMVLLPPGPDPIKVTTGAHFKAF